MPLPAPPDVPPAAPESNGLFVRLKPRGAMAAPIGGRASMDEVTALPAGARVVRGQPLASRWPESAAAPLACASGVVKGLGRVRLWPGHEQPAVVYEVTPEAEETSAASPDSFVGSSPAEIAASSATSAADAAVGSVDDLSAIPSLPPTHGSSSPASVDFSSASPADLAAMLTRLKSMDLAAGIERLRQRGVWVDRWATPDLLAQLISCQRKPIDLVLCDALDESPDLLLNNRLTAAHPVEFVAGALALASLTGAPSASVVMPAYGDSRSLDAVRRAAAGSKLKLIFMADHYPQSHPSLLIHELTGRHVRPVKLPTEVGVLVAGVPACIAVGRCFLFDAPLLEAPLAFRDNWRQQTHWLSVPIGLPWSSVLEQLGIQTTRVDLRAGHPLRENHLELDSVVCGVELTVTAGLHDRFINPDPCIRCAWCVEGCPVRIQPAGLLDAAQQDDPYLAEQYGLDACIECGICSYVCPSHLPILAGIRSLRAITRRGRQA